MSLLYPETLWYLLGLLPLFTLLLLGYRRSRRGLELLTGQWRAGSVYNVLLVKSFFSVLLLILFFVFGLLAASGVTWGRRTVEDDRSGVDLVFVLDTSRSMLADDLEPSRLARSRDAVRAALRELDFNRFSLVVFRGDAVTAIPMTEDTVSIDNFLAGVSVQVMTSPGSDPASGLTEALDAFPPGTNRHRLILLLSDGESVGGGDLEEAVARAAREDIPVFTVAAGTGEGTRIPLGDTTFLTDEAGNPVLSRVDVSALEGIAEETGGAFISLEEAGAISEILSSLEEHYRSVSADGLRTVSVERYQTFLSLALLFLLLYVILGALRWRSLF